MARIEYRPPIVGSIEFISVRGTIPADRMRTLSSQPFIIIPALEIPADKYLCVLQASADMLYGVTTLAFPMGLTWNNAIKPILEMAPNTPGGGMVTAVPSWYGSGFDISFDINNINFAAKPALVWKASADTAAADFEDVPFEVIYYLRETLFV